VRFSRGSAFRRLCLLLLLPPSMPPSMPLLLPLHLPSLELFLVVAC
jgi:hypothetical protein